MYQSSYERRTHPRTRNKAISTRFTRSLDKPWSALLDKPAGITLIHGQAHHWLWSTLGLVWGATGRIVLVSTGVSGIDEKRGKGGK